MGFNNTNLSAKDRIVLALDTDSLEEVERLVKLLKDYVGCFKVGPQLFILTENFMISRLLLQKPAQI